MVILRQVNDSEDDAKKAYWKELYVGGFDTLLDDLKDRMYSPLIRVFVEIENVLLNSINSPMIPISIDLMDKAYGSKSNQVEAPLDGITVDELKTQLEYLKTQWVKVNGDKEASSFVEIVHFVRDSIRDQIALRHWETSARYVLTLLRLILVAAGTSAFAERTFSLSRHIKTWLRADMDDTTFDNLGLLAWYKDDIDTIIDGVKVGNAFIAEKAAQRKKFYGAQFKEEDFINP